MPAITVETANLSETLRQSCIDAYTRWETAFSEALVAGGMPARDARYGRDRPASAATRSATAGA